MDATAAVLKRKGAEAPEPWAPVPATKIRRLDAEARPVEFGVGAPLVGPGAGVPPPPPQQAFGVEAAPAVDATLPVLKRKAAEGPQPWLDVDGVTPPAPKIRRLVRTPSPRLRSLSPCFRPMRMLTAFDCVGVGRAGCGGTPVEAAVSAPLVEPGASVPFVAEEVLMSGAVAPAAAAAAGLAAPAGNDERAIVVYQPAEAARSLLEGPLRPGPTLRVSPDWIHGLRSTMLQEASNHRALFEELAARDENLNLAVVPWSPAEVHAHAASRSAATADEMMDADQDGDGASMEVEHQPTPPAAGVALQGEAFHHQQQQQWPPQHCVAPQQVQLPAASYQPSPVTWSW